MTHEATELKLFIDNDSELYRRQTKSILKNLATKKVTSKYKHDLAVKLFGYLVESGAKKYAKEFDDAKRWHKIFSVADRKQVAEALTRDFEGEFELGNYDEMLPKKYQKQMITGETHFPRAHATMKASHERMHDPKVLRASTDRQVRTFYQDEKHDAQRAKAEATRRGMTVHATKKKTMADYEDEGYRAHTWYLASCPYSQPKIRDAWQRGAWKWQQEQRGTRDRAALHTTHATIASSCSTGTCGHGHHKKSEAQLAREVNEVLARRGGR